jgi:hypothetical protein
VSSAEKTIRQKLYAAGIEYSDSMFKYNRTWEFAAVEREFGKARNALFNHAHFNPILTATYSGTKATAASSLGSTLVEKTMNTIDAGIAASIADPTNPRFGPYVILCGTANLSMIQRALTIVPQEGSQLQNANMLGLVRAVVAYDGWAKGFHGRAVSYAGVTANKAYLIDTQNNMYDFQSKVSNPLRRQEQAGDLRRFVRMQVIFDSEFGLYAAPGNSVQELTLPTS